MCGLCHCLYVFPLVLTRLFPVLSIKIMSTNLIKYYNLGNIQGRRISSNISLVRINAETFPTAGRWSDDSVWTLSLGGESADLVNKIDQVKLVTRYICQVINVLHYQVYTVTHNQNIGIVQYNTIPNTNQVKIHHYISSMVIFSTILLLLI